MRTIEDVKSEIKEVRQHEESGVKEEYLENLKREFLYMVVANIPLDRLEEICQAEREGRLVVLPCKVGDTVYQVKNRWSKCSAHDCEFDEYSCQGCEELECDSKRMYYIKDYSPRSINFIVDNILPRIGRSVFLTREEAEAALEGAKHE